GAGAGAGVSAFFAGSAGLVSGVGLPQPASIPDRTQAVNTNSAVDFIYFSLSQGPWEGAISTTFSRGSKSDLGNVPRSCLQVLRRCIGFSHCSIITIFREVKFMR